MKKFSIALIFFCAFILIACGEIAVEEDIFSPVRTQILETLEKAKTASLSVAVARNGKIIWEEGFGLADLEKKIKASPHTMYSLASVSKPITATGLMVLVERGLVKLDKPANFYLGDGKLTSYEGKASGATVMRLLSHTAGLPMHWNFFYENELLQRPGMDESIRRFGIIATPPGEEFHYSNFGYGIIDHIISRVSGKSYPDFMKTEVFEPLGMTRTSIPVGPGLEDHAAQRYDKNQKPIPFYDFDHRGASAVWSCAHDLVRFGMFHLKNHLEDQKQILKEDTIDAMQKEKDPKVPDSGYGLGWSLIDLHGYRFVSHSGGMPGVSTRLTLIPSENLATVLLCNGEMPDLWKIELAVYTTLLPELAKKLEVEEIKPEEEEQAKFSPPGSLLGEWIGEVKADGKTLPARLVFKENAQVSLELDGKIFSPLTMKTPLGDVKFKDSIFQGPFYGNFNIFESVRSPHIPFIRVRLKGQRLSGYIAAVATNQRFCLPFWIELKRQ